MYHGATAVYLSTTPAHRNLGSLLTSLKPLPKTQGLCITATPNMDSEDVESIAQYSRVKIQQNTLYVVVDPGKEKGILCSNLLLHTELQFEACSDWSCIRCNRGWFTPASNQHVDHQHEDGSKFASTQHIGGEETGN